MGDITNAQNSAIAKSNLAYSGTIDYSSKLQERRTNQDYNTGLKSLYQSLGSDLYDLTMAQTREIGSLDVRLAQAQGQKEAYQQQFKNAGGGTLKEGTIQKWTGGAFG